MTTKIHHVSVDYPAEALRFYIESTDVEKRTVTMQIFGKKINPKYFQSVKATFMVFPREDTHSLVKLKIVCVNNRSDPKDRITLLFYNTLARHIMFIDSNLYELNHTQNSIDSEYPAEECFKAFIKACEDDDAVVEIHTKDSVKGTTTISLMRCTDVWMTKFNSLKVIITITPREGDNYKGSHVEWTTEAEELSDNPRDKKFFETTAKLIHEIIGKKLPKK
ncbi:hypothetical protein Bca52824_032374 [Brassica carinata]|uniref:Uncharacterized protein n=1 Tax=Brassica carinata TaxID=52824 RepID=A0A8X7SCL8_BRACI|nr:hypothetical protein Bca52824_032374 [Brassica carinata]